MINPIFIVISVAVILSAAAIVIINKPKFPIIAGAILVVLIFFVFATFTIDNAITDLMTSGELNSFVRFAVIKDKPTYEDLESAFTILSCIDVGLFIASLVAMFIETMTILHKNSKM